MRKIFLSFAARLTFYILTLSGAIFLCLALAFYWFGRERDQQQAIEVMQLRQLNMMVKTDYQLASVEQNVRHEYNHILRHLDHPEDMMRIVRAMVEEDTLMYGGYVAFAENYYPNKGKRFMEYAYTDSLGKIHEMHMSGNSDYDYLSSQWFSQVRQHPDGYWTAPYIDRGIDGYLSITYCLPLFDEAGRFIASINADVKVADLAYDMFVTRPYADSYSFILNTDGRFIAHPDQKVVLNKDITTYAKEVDSPELKDIAMKMVKGEKGCMQTSIKGEKVMACYAPMQHVNWFVCTICPVKSVVGVLGSTVVVIFAILLIGLLTLSLCIRLLVTHITRPIKEMTSAAYLISQGRFNAPLPEVESKDDLRALHDAFQNMQQSLVQYMDKLKSSTRRHERINSELNIAHGIQMSMVPKTFSPFPECERLELYGYLRPAKEIGGDLYDFFIRDNRLFFTIGDVSGKGVPASLVMAITSALFRVLAHKEDSPARIIESLNKTLCEGNEYNMFVTLYVGVLDLTTGHLTYSSAGHNPPLLLHRDGTGEYQQIGEVYLPVGILAEAVYKDETADLSHGEALLLYTDGLTEGEDIRHESFGEEKALTAAAQAARLPAKEIVEHTLHCLSDFVGNAVQSDDLTLLCLRLKEQ